MSLIALIVLSLLAIVFWRFLIAVVLIVLLVLLLLGVQKAVELGHPQTPGSAASRNAADAPIPKSGLIVPSASDSREG